MERLLLQEQDNPFDREVKEQIITLARSQGLIAEASAARFRLLEYYPLTEAMWLEWLEDELSPDLFHKALKDFFCMDYLDPKVAYEWLKYCQINSIGQEQMNDVLLKVNSPEMWKLYRAGLNDDQGVRQAFERQIGLPGPALPSVWQEYQDWEQDKSRVAKTQEKYLQVFAIYKKIEPLYKQVSLDVSKAAKEVVAQHIDELLVHLSSSAGVSIIEQTLIAFPSLPNLWRSYVMWLVFFRQTEKKESSAAVRSILKRAVRNCYWDLTFHLDLILISEQMQKPCDSKNHSGLFSQALQSPFQTQSDYLTVWKAKYEWGRRTGQDSGIIGEAAVAWLKQYTTGLHIQFQLYIAPDLQKEEALALFETVVREQGDMYSNWYFYSKWLERVGDIKTLRSVLKRGLEFTKDQVKEMSDLYLETEGKLGSIEEIRAARLKVYKRLKRIEPVAKVHVPPVPKPTPIPVANDTRHTVFVKYLSQDVRDDELKDLFSQVCTVLSCRIVRDLKGRSRGIAYADLSSDEDIHHCVEAFNGTMLDGAKIMVAASAPPGKANKDSKTVFVNNLPFELADEELLAEFLIYGKVADVRIIRNPQGLCRGYAYIEFTDESSVLKALETPQKSIKGRLAQILQANSQKEQSSVLHVSNLEYTVNEEDLKSFFTNVKQVHIPVDPQGKSKGFAFVEFENEEAAKFALSLPEPTLKNRAMVVKRSTREIKPKKSNTDFKKLI